MYGWMAGWLMIRRVSFLPATITSRSAGAERYCGWIAGGAAGSDDLMRTWPRLCGRNWQTEAMKPGNVCSDCPTDSALNRMKWICTSGEANDGSVLKKPPA